MRVLIDTNIVLDVLLSRQPFAADSDRVWQANEEGRITGYITATTLTDIFYIARKEVGLDKAHAAVLVCLDAFEVCPVDKPTLRAASALPGNDFEDNLQIACLKIAGLDAFVTRDKGDFSNANVPVLTPLDIR